MYTILLENCWSLIRANKKCIWIKNHRHLFSFYFLPDNMNFDGAAWSNIYVIILLVFHKFYVMHNISTGMLGSMWAFWRASQHHNWTLDVSFQFHFKRPVLNLLWENISVCAKLGSYWSQYLCQNLTIGVFL